MWAEINGIINFKIKVQTKPNEEKSWHLTFSNGNVKIEEGLEETANCTLSFSDDDFDSLCKDKMNPIVAFLFVLYFFLMKK